MTATEQRRTLARLANELENTAHRLRSRVPPGHVDYISKADAALCADAAANELRNIIEPQENHDQ